jgi:hypothetical protein
MRNDQKNKYERMLRKFGIMQAHFAELERNGFKEQFPEKYSQGVRLLHK